MLYSIQLRWELEVEAYSETIESHHVQIFYLLDLTLYSTFDYEALQ